MQPLVTFKLFKLFKLFRRGGEAKSSKGEARGLKHGLTRRPISDRKRTLARESLRPNTDSRDGQSPTETDSGAGKSATEHGFTRRTDNLRPKMYSERTRSDTTHATDNLRPKTDSAAGKSPTEHGLTGRTNRTQAREGEFPTTCQLTSGVPEDFGRKASTKCRLNVD